MLGRANQFLVRQERFRRPVKICGRNLAGVFLSLIRFLAQAVLITASGLLGDQPLVNRSNVDKGSRQNRSVTSGKGLALKVA